MDKLVLLVEDSIDDELLVERALGLSGQGCQMVVARDGEQALEYLLGEGTPAGQPPPVTPSVIFLDLQLPKMDGLEVLRRIRADERTKWIPVVILTASNQKEDILQSYRNGANSFIYKPVDFDEFVELVRLLANYWLHFNNLPK